MRDRNRQTGSTRAASRRRAKLIEMSAITKELVEIVSGAEAL